MANLFLCLGILEILYLLCIKAVKQTHITKLKLITDYLSEC